MAKKTPARGALNVARFPPRHRTRPAPADAARPAGLSRPSVDPSADPIWTMGPSRPTDPPPPMHNAEARALTAATWAAIRPPRCGRRHTSPPGRRGRAPPVRKGAPSGPYNSPATTGATTTNQRPSPGQARMRSTRRRRVVHVSGEDPREGDDQPAEGDGEPGRSRPHTQGKREQAGVGGAQPDGCRVRRPADQPSGPHRQGGNGVLRHELQYAIVGCGNAKGG